MTTRIHALVIRVVESLLRGVGSSLRIAGAYGATTEQTQSGPDARAVTTGEDAPDCSAENRPDNSAADRCVGRRFTRSPARCLHRVLPARRIVMLKLINWLSTAGHRGNRRAGRDGDAACERSRRDDREEYALRFHRVAGVGCGVTRCQPSAQLPT